MKGETPIALVSPLPNSVMRSLVQPLKGVLGFILTSFFERRRLCGLFILYLVEIRRNVRWVAISRVLEILASALGALKLLLWVAGAAHALYETLVLP